MHPRLGTISLMVGRKIITLLFGGLILCGGGASAQDTSESLKKKVARIDKRFKKILAQYAKEFDKKSDPEAAHFFAECAIGFGIEDKSLLEEIKVIKVTSELDIYLGKKRGGEILTDKEVDPLKGKFGTSKRKFAKHIKTLVARATGHVIGESGGVAKKAHKPQELTKEEKQILVDIVVKYEIAAWSHEYVQSIKRINALRLKMGLKAVLWSFEHSKKLILASWYWGETDDSWGSDIRRLKDSVFWTDDVEWANKNSNKGLHQLKRHVKDLRAHAIVRQSLLNPNARQLYLGHWTEWFNYGWGVSTVCYNIPQLPYRKDIPTPTSRYKNQTVVKGWVDTEETLNVNGTRIPFVRYPYPNEPDAPWAFSDGQGSEGAFDGPGWIDPSRPDKHGVPIMLRFYGEADLSDIETSMTPERGKTIECFVFTEKDKKHVQLKDWPTILILPKPHLKKGTKYTVSISCKVSGAEFEKTWSFTTRKK